MANKSPGRPLGRGIAVISVADSWVLQNKVDSTDSDGIMAAAAVDDATGAIYRSRNVRFKDNVIERRPARRRVRRRGQAVRRDPLLSHLHR